MVRGLPSTPPRKTARQEKLQHSNERRGIRKVQNPVTKKQQYSLDRISTGVTMLSWIQNESVYPSATRTNSTGFTYLKKNAIDQDSN
jgi:hypothetical protein